MKCQNNYKLNKSVRVKGRFHQTNLTNLTFLKLNYVEGKVYVKGCFQAFQSSIPQSELFPTHITIMTV